MVILHPTSLCALCAFSVALHVPSSGLCREDDLKPLLVKLTSQDPAVQDEGMSDLFLTHDGVLACLPPLVEIATTSTPENRAAALRLISGFGPHGKSAAPKLYPLLEYEEDRIRIAVAGAILSLETRNDAAVDVLGKALQAKRFEDRFAAAQELFSAGLFAKGAIPSLIAATKDENPQVRMEVVRALARVTPIRNKEVVAIFHELLADKSPGIAGAAAAALWDLDEPAETLVPTLIKLVQEFKVDPKRDVTQDIWGHDAGVEVLGEIGPEAKAAVPVLIAALDSKQAGERLAAADALGEIGPEAKSAIPRLAKSLRETETHTFVFAHHAWYVSDQAAIALRRIGPASRPILVAALADQNERVRAIAANELGQMPADKETAAALTKLLGDRDESVRAVSAFNLGRMKSVANDAVPLLAAHLNDAGEWVSFPGGGIGSRFSVGQHVLEALFAIDPKAEVIVPEMIDSLKKDRRIEAAMLGMLQHLGPGAKDAMPALEPLLRDEKQRLGAAQAIAKISPDYPGLFEILKKELDAGKVDFQKTIPAARGLGDLKAQAKEAIPALYAALEDQGEPSARVIIAAAIVKIDSSEARAVRTLAEELRQSPERFFLFEGHSEAAKVWPTLGPAAKPAEELLIAGLSLELPDKDQDYFWQPRREKELHLRSAELLISAGSAEPAIIDTLIRLCDCDDCGTRGGAADALGKIGPAAAKAVPALVQMLSDDELYLVGGDFYGNGGVRNLPGEHAAAALSRIGAPAVAALQAELRNENSLIRLRAVSALGQIGPPAKKSADSIVAALKDEKQKVRAAALGALSAISDNRAETIAAMIPLLRDDHLLVRVAAAKALEKAGAAAKPAVPELRRLREDPYELARNAAEESIAAIEKSPE